MQFACDIFMVIHDYLDVGIDIVRFKFFLQHIIAKQFLMDRLWVLLTVIIIQLNRLPIR